MITIKIHDANYRVELVDPLHVALGGGDYTGRCDIHQGIIYISNRLSDHTRRRTIQHEITHAVIWEYTQKRNADSWTEEELVTFVEQYLDTISILTFTVMLQLDTYNEEG